MIKGECDCCGARDVRLSRCWPMGMETYACAKCKGSVAHEVTAEEAQEKELIEYDAALEAERKCK